MTTIVSCFITNVNNIKYRNTDKYLELGKLLIECDVPKVIFMNQYLIDSIKDYNRENTIFIPFEKEDLFFYKYKNDITEFSVDTDNVDKDTLDYMLLMNNKTEFIQKAIELNPFHTEQFIWIDFGIKHVINVSNDYTKYINNLNNKSYENVRIPYIIDPRIYNNNNKDIYKNINWYFAGGVFGGSSQKLLLFVEKCREKVKEVIREKKSLMWEVNIWYLVFLENKKLFYLYQANHNDSILKNY